MRKSIFVFVFFILMIVLMVGCTPTTFMPPAKVNVDPGDNITDVSIAVDGNGIKHIVGLKDNRVVYFKGNIGEPTYQFTIGWGLLPVGTDTSTWRQYQPEIAVVDNGTAHIVWWEHHGNPDEKIACHYEVPLIYPPSELKSCRRLDEQPNYTTGLVRVIAKWNTAYAVYDRMDSSGFVDSVWYKELEEPSTAGHVVKYLEASEEPTIYFMELAIDKFQKLHLVYIDEVTSTLFPYPRLLYRSNSTTNMDRSMRPNWLIDSWPSVEVKPSIDFNEEGSNTTYVMIASVRVKNGKQEIWIDRCNIIECTDKLSFSPTSGNIDWNTSSEIREVKGLGILGTYTLSFIGHNDLSSIDQVWQWTSPFSGNPTPITNTNYAKSQLNMVMGFFPVIGFVESWQMSDPTVYLEKVSIYDSIEFLREVGTYVCPVHSELYSSDMASYLFSSTNNIPVAGVWNYCGRTWFTTNAHLTSLPLIVK